MIKTKLLSPSEHYTNILSTDYNLLSTEILRIQGNKLLLFQSHFVLYCTRCDDLRGSANVFGLILMNLTSLS